MNTQTHKNNDTPCWYCKRNPAYGVYNPEDFTQYDQTCPWLEDGIPIKGWKVKRGVCIDITDAEGNLQHEFGYEIKYCPLYKEGISETTYYEYLNKVQRSLGYCKGIGRRPCDCYERAGSLRANAAAPPGGDGLYHRSHRPRRLYRQ